LFVDGCTNHREQHVRRIDFDYSRRYCRGCYGPR
jgi:hypothetical protein